MTTQSVSPRLIVSIAEDHGSKFFRPDTMRFFNSRAPLQCHMVEVPDHTPMYVFITSEKFDNITPRAYTVRMMDSKGNIETVNTDDTIGYAHHSIDGFQAYPTMTRAVTAMRRLIALIESGNTPTRQWHNWH